MREKLPNKFVTTKHMAWDRCFVPVQNTNQKISLFLLSVNYMSDWRVININYHKNILAYKKWLPVESLMTK